jgi:hypothetical protein
VVERNNRVLGDSLRAMLLERTQEDWDWLLPHIMRALRGTPHSVTGETPNLMMLGRELRLPDQLLSHPPLEDNVPQAKYVQNMLRRLQEVHEALSEQQIQLRQEGQEEPLLFAEGDLVWLENRRRRKGENPKLQQKFVGPYYVVEAWPNHTYTIERQGQRSTQNECRLKLYHACPETAGRAPGTQEVARRPNMKGAVHRKSRLADPEPVLTGPAEAMLERLEEAVRGRLASSGNTPELEPVPPPADVPEEQTPAVEPPLPVEQTPPVETAMLPPGEEAQHTPVVEEPSTTSSRPRRQIQPLKDMGTMFVHHCAVQTSKRAPF